MIREILTATVDCVKRAAPFRCVFAALIVLAPAALTQCPPSAQGADQPSKAAEPANASGITDVSHGSPALATPRGNTKGQVLKYGLGQIFQVAPRTAAVSCNIRTVGTGHWDFENGTDIVVFDDLATIGRQKRIVVARNEEYRNPATGKKIVAVTYPINIGFVPLGAKRDNGSAHPHAGTGFGFSLALSYDLNDQGYYVTLQETPSATNSYVHQFTYDGLDFHVVKKEAKSADTPLKTADGAWAITAPGLSAAIADGDDLLLAMSASDGERKAAGVSRWRCQGGDWGPVAFHAVSDGNEPSLVRDIDGSLLYSVRGHGGEGHTVRVWRSGDSGQNWEQVFHDPKLRANTPVVLNQAADGTPYITGNQPGSFRATLCLWPLNSERTECKPAITVRNCVGDFGSAPEGTTWFADHPMATIVQLADGKWHSLLGYRVMAFKTAGVGGETVTPRTGCYIEQILSAGPARPAWQF